MAIIEFHQVSLCVADLDRSLRFYRDLLGCRLVAENAFWGEPACRALGVSARALRTALLARDGIRLELLCFADARPDHTGSAPDRIGLSHLSFVVDDLDATVQSLRDRGVEVVEATRADLGAGCVSCLVRDPDGMAVLLLERPPGVVTPYDGPDREARRSNPAT